MRSSQLRELDVDRSASTREDSGAAGLRAADIPKQVAFILKIQVHTFARQFRPFAGPIAEKVLLVNRRLLVAIATA